jgi:hypothetical protein
VLDAWISKKKDVAGNLTRLEAVEKYLVGMLL